MKTLVEKRNAAGDRYAAAVVELRAAFTDLAALDRLLSTPSFGPPPEIVPFRHPTFAPNVSGSFVDDIPAAIAAHSAAAAGLASTLQWRSDARDEAIAKIVATLEKAGITFLSETPKGVGLRGKIKT